MPPPRVETALLWDLLDYAVSSSPIVHSGGSSDNVELNVNTQFLSPLNQDARPRPASTQPHDSAQDAFGPNFWTDTTFEFDMGDFSNFPDTSILPNDAWINGHL